MMAAVLLALAPQGGTAATAATPAPVTEPTMMIVEFPRGVPVIGLPARCPGSTDEEPAENEICIAELYQGPALVVRHLFGPRAERRAPVRLTAHARRWPAGTRMLVVTRPFTDRKTSGNFAVWWHLPEEDGDFCVETEELTRWGDGPATRQFMAGYRRRFRPRGYSERADFRCIRGHPVVIRDL